MEQPLFDPATKVGTGVGLLTTLVGFVIPAYQPEVVFLGVVLASWFIIAGVCEHIDRRRKPGAAPVTEEKPTTIHNVTSHNQSGGVTAHTVNVGKPQRVMTPGLKAQILALPKDRPVDVVGMLGDPESITLAAEIHAFFRANGFSMTDGGGPGMSVFTGAPTGLTCDPESNPLKFIVGFNR